MRELEWKKLVRRFKKEEGILFLGPKLKTIQKEGSWKTIEEEIAGYFTQTLKEYEVAFDDSEETRANLSYTAQKLFATDDIQSRIDVGDMVDMFMEEFREDHPQNELPEVLKQIAKLPVNVFVNTSFDNLIVDALEQEGKNPQFYFYNFAHLEGSVRQIGKHSAPQINIDEIDVDRPLVFNLFGVLDEIDSLVLTEVDQVDFIKHVLEGKPPLPDALLSFFNPSSKSCVFLGFDFNNWQYRMLLNSFNLRGSASGFHIANIQKGMVPSAVNQDFFQDRSSFGFIFSEQESKTFLKELISRVIPESEEKSARLHIIYTQEDLELWEELEKNLIPIKGLSYTDSGTISATGKRSDAIKKFIAEADHILLLMSPDFLINEDIQDLEMPLVLEKRKKNPKTQIIPILLKHCLWREDENLKRLKPIPENWEPASDDEEWGGEDNAYYVIAQELKGRIL